MYKSVWQDQNQYIDSRESVYRQSRERIVDMDLRWSQRGGIGSVMTSVVQFHL